MTPQRRCLKCGAPLAADPSEGFCQKCLFLQAGVGLLTAALDPDAGEQERGGSGQRREEGAAKANDRLETANCFGDYELLEAIGRGGMGVVYRARQKSLDRIVAIKMMAFGPGSSPEMVKRFRAEALAAAALQHPNIVAIHEVGIHEGRHFFVMDYVEGQSLATIVGNQPLPAQRAAAYLRTISEAVHYAHERGILHRDLKPSNIIIDGQSQPRIVDFGLARRLEGGAELTVTGQVLGSPHYLPPEQATATRGRVSRRTDVYGLGATLYHLLTGRPPFQAESLAQTLDLVLQTEPVGPRMLNPAVPRDLETICLKCLEKEPARRYATARELADELERFQAGQPIQARPLGPTGRTWRWCRRYPLTASLAGAVMLLFLSGFVGVLEMWHRSESQRQRAEAGEYVLAMNAAQAAIKADNPGRALELLEGHPPEASLSARHSPLSTAFEWRYLWQQCQTEAEVVGQLPSRIRSLEVSPDGRWLVAGSELGGVMLWDLGTKEELLLAPEAGTNGGIKAFATFSPDSALVAFTDQTYQSPGGRISLLETRTRKQQAPITDSWYTGGTLAFSSDGSLFAYGVCGPHFERGAVVMDFARRKQIALAIHRTRITSDMDGFDAVFTADARSIIFSENNPDRRLALWSFLGEMRTNYFPAHGEAITAMAISPDGETLASAARYTETAIRLWEVPSFRPLGELRGHQQWVAGLKFSPDGRTLASAGTDKTVRLWDVSTKSLRRSFPPLSHAVYRVCFAPDGGKVFGGTGDGSIHCWKVNAPAPRSAWREPAQLDSVAVSSDGSTLAGIRQGMVCLSKVGGGAPTTPLVGLGTNNLSLLFSPGGDTLFAGGQQGEVQIWSLSGHQPRHRLQLPDEPVVALRQDAAGQMLIVAQGASEPRPGRSCRVGIWRTRDWREQRAWTFTAAVPCFAASPDGRWLATGHLEGPVQVWDLARACGARTLSFSGRISGVTFSPDGKLLAATSREGIVKVWAVRGFRELPGFRAHSGDLRTLVFSADSRRLLTAGANEEALKFWDVATRQELITIGRPEESLKQVAFSADGNQLTARSTTGDVLVWSVPSWAEILAKKNP